VVSEAALALAIVGREDELAADDEFFDAGGRLSRALVRLPRVDRPPTRPPRRNRAPCGYSDLKRGKPNSPEG